MYNNNTVNIKLNADLNGYKKGKILKIIVDKKGIPVDNYWYRRLKDAEIDNCIEIIDNKKQNKNYPNKKNKKEDTINERHVTQSYD